MSEGPIITGRLQLKDETGQTLKTIQGKISSVTRKIGLAAAGLGVAMVAGIGAGIKVAADFEQQMIEASKVIEGFDLHRGMLEDLAKTMSEKWAVGTSEVTRAMAFMGSMGKDAITIQQELNDVITMGIALNMDMESAARLVASAQAIFSKEGLSAAKVADKLNAITNKTAATTDFLAGALLMAGPAAAATGVSMNELLGVMTPLAAAGFQGSMAGRALNTIFPTLSSSAGELQSGLANLHDQGFDVNMAAMEGFAEASPYDQIVALSKATKNLTQDQKREIATFIGGTQFFKQMYILLEDGEGILEGTSYAIESLGSAQEEANKTTQSFNFRLAQLKQRILFMGMDIGQRLLPAMKGFLDMVDAWIPAIGSAIAAIAEGDWGAVEESFNNLATMAGGLWDNVKESLGDWGEKFMEILPADAEGWGTLFDPLLESVGTLWGLAMEKLGDWGEKFKTDIIPQDEEGWNKVWGVLFDWADTVWDNIKGMWVTAWGTLWDFLPADAEEWWNIFTALKTFAENLWTFFFDTVKDFGECMATYLGEVDWTAAAQEFVKFSAMAVEAFWNEFVKLLRGKFTGLGPSILQSIPGPGVGGVTSIYDIISTLLSGTEGLYPVGVPGIAFGGGYQAGGSGVVSKPTMFLAGEAGPESYSFTPLGAGSQDRATPVIRIGAIYITAGDLGSEYGRGLAARDIVEQLGKEWRRQR